LDVISVNFVGFLGYECFAAGSHTSVRRSRRQLLGHGGVNPVGLLTAELVVSNYNLVGNALVALGIIVAGINKAVDVLLIHILSLLDIVLTS